MGRAGPFTDIEADEILADIEDAGDGYGRAEVFYEATVRIGDAAPVVVLEWAPDRAERDW